MNTYRQLRPPDTRGQISHDLTRTLGSVRRTLFSRMLSLLIRDKNFDHLSCATRSLGCLVTNFAPVPKLGENFGLDHCLLSHAGTPHFKDAT
jgi:hypothetical protein